MAEFPAPIEVVDDLPLHVPVGSRTEPRTSAAWVGLAAAASGAMMSAGYWPLHAHWLAWVALVPWLIVLPRLSAGAAWQVGALVGLVFYTTGVAWLFSVNTPLAGLLVLGLAVLMGLAFRVTRLLMDRFGNATMLWALPLAYVGQEVLRCEALPRMRFPFLALGYTQSHNLWIAQIASIFGVYGLSFLIVLVNAALAWAILQRRPRAALPAIASIGTVVLLAWASQPRDYSHLPRIPAACVQLEDQNLEHAQDLVRQAVDDPSQPRLLVLPEHLVPQCASAIHPVIHMLADIAKACRAVICVGVHTSAPQDASCDFSNIAMLIGSDGQILSRQPKMVPLPFFRDGEPGTSQTIANTRYGHLGTYICYDGLFTDLPRRVVSAGAELLLVPNLDDPSWPVQQRWQHADMSPFRSIELRRCAVRANGAGISQIIDATGHPIATRTKQDGSGLVLGDVYLCNDRTLFVRGGYVFAPALAALFLAAIAWLTWKEKTDAETRRRGEREGWQVK